MIRVFRHYISYRWLLQVISETLLLTAIVFVGTSWPLLTQDLGARGFSAPLRASLLSSFAIAVLCQTVMFFNELYDWRYSTNTRERTWKLAVSCGVSLIALALIIFVLGFFGLRDALGFPRVAGGWDLTERVILSIVGAFFLLWIYRWFFHWAIVTWKFGERVLVMGAGPQALELAEAVYERGDSGYEVFGLIPPGGGNGAPAKAPGYSVLPVVYGDVNDLYDIVSTLSINRVVIAMEDRRGNLPTAELLKVRMSGVRIEEREFLYEKITGKISVESLRPSYLIFSEGFRKNRWTLTLKRLTDVFTASLGLILSAPIMLLVSIAIRLDSRGPILFRQERTGQDGRTFNLYKFRSMTADAEAKSGPVWSQEGDARITRVGGLLRKSRLDELPQLWNVLRGDMSFVGPRPERPFFVQELAQEIPYYTQRLTVKPGVTGWAQISYPYGSSRFDAIQKLQYDLYYIKNISLLFDLSILARTIKVVVIGKGGR